MVGTILPIVYGERTRGRAPRSVWLHALGSLMGAVLFGGLLALPGRGLSLDSLPALASAGLVLALAVAHVGYAGHEFELWRLPLPQSSWQVPRTWQRRMPALAVSFLYGATLSLGVLTRVTSSAFYIVLLWVIVLGSPWMGAVIMAGYGIGRIVPVLALFLAARDLEHAYRGIDAITPWRPLMRIVNGLLLASSGGWLLQIAVSRTFN
jgi:cytochrome c biogenesis protein CcdA